MISNAATAWADRPARAEYQYLGALSRVITKEARSGRSAL